LEVQHLFYPHTLKGDRRFDVTEHAAEQSKYGTKAKTERNENVRGMKHYILVIFKFVEDADSS
jgi:hypothetical protein